MDPVSIESFITKSLDLLEKERNAEIEENSLLQEQVPLKELQRRGVCLLKLRLLSHHTGLYGRTVLVFEPFWESKELPSHKFTPGDIAGLQLSQGSWSPDDLLASGIVSCVTANSIQVAFEESFDHLTIDNHTQYKLLRLANDVTYRRLKRTLEELQSSQQGDTRHLVSVLFGQTELGPPLNKARDGIEQDIILYNDSLDSSQQEAVKFALMQREVAIIHGPPGTGKTTTVTEIILQAVKQGNKLLVCAPSNIAVDNLVEKLSHYKIRMVRLGHPARVLPSIQKYSLDAILAHSDETQLVEDVKKDIDKSLLQMKKTNDKGERQRLKNELKHLRKELRFREAKAIKDILYKVDVVLCTLTMATTEGPLKYLNDQLFDITVIDECSQALEVACWTALQRGTRCVLAGDHNQLPPTIISHEAAKEGLSFTLMERLLKLHGDKIMRMLTTQYRMHENIMQWPSDQLYDGRLTAHESVAKHLLRDLSGVKDTDITSIPLLLIDTAGCDLPELCLVDELSKGNEGEADVVTSHIQQLVECGLQPKDIAVIAPYNLQVELLRIRLSEKYPGLEIKSVDGFQGREKEAVIISLVRSNEKGEVGFLAEDRRINVAITRARRHLAVVCDSDTVSNHKFLKAMVDYMTEKGEIRSAQQYIEAGALDHNYKRPEYIDDRICTQQTQVKDKPKEHKQKSSMKQTKKETKPKDNKKTQQTSSISEPVRNKDKQEETESSDWTAGLIEKCITDLMVNSEMESYAFPPSLTGNDRKSVHEICEKLGLLHVSVGIGAKRHIVISKPRNPTEEEQDNKQHPLSPSPMAVKTEKDNDHEEDKPTHFQEDTKRSGSHTVTEVKLETKLCDKCSKLVPAANYELHNIRCSRSQPVSLAPSGGTKPKCKKLKSAKTKTLESSADLDDFDSLIAEAIKENTTCHYPKCKNNAATLGQNCQFCARRFCLTHFIAEAHGCGDAVRAHARATVCREGILYRGSGVPDKKPDPTKRAHLERKLNKKLDELTDKRKHKKKS